MTVLLAILTLLAVWIVYLHLKRKIQNKRASGQKVVLEYSDQNERIASQLPRTGVIGERIKIEKTTDNFVVKLDQPIHFDNFDFEEIIVTPRRIGQYVGSTKEIHVHLLLPKVDLAKDKYVLSDFNHVAWLTMKPS